MITILGAGLWKLSPLFRSPSELANIQNFLTNDPMKEHVLACFATGFVSHFRYKLPQPQGSKSNYGPLKTKAGQVKFTAAMRKEVLAGHMLGGPGWTSQDVRRFFGGRHFQGIPSGAVPKGGDPLGRIVHDYGFYPAKSYSINASHSCTRVKYKSFKETAEVLEHVRWYIKADLKSGYRQFGTHPVDQRHQVYNNGPGEHYIDLGCSYGKTNSALEFCPPIRLFAMSAAQRQAEANGGEPPNMATYVDDINGGFVFNDSYQLAQAFRDFICSSGASLTMEFNMDVKKTPLPAREQTILGHQQNSKEHKISVAPKKIVK